MCPLTTSNVMATNLNSEWLYFDKLFKNLYVAQDIYFLSIEIIDKK